MDEIPGPSPESGHDRAADGINVGQNDDGTISFSGMPKSRHICLPDRINVDIDRRQPTIPDLLAVSILGCLACLVTYFQAHPRVWSLSILVVCSLWASIRIASSFDKKSVAHPSLKLAVVIILFCGSTLAFLISTEAKHIDERLWGATIASLLLSHCVSAVFAGSTPRELERYAAMIQG